MKMRKNVPKDIRGGTLMKLLTFNQNGEQFLGVKTEEGVINLSLALQTNPAPHIETDIMDLIKQGEDSVRNLQEYVETLPKEATNAYMIDEATLTFAPAVTRPSKIICVGLNYKKHADETGLPYPEYPVL